jgi:hypothetical protein
MGMLSALRDWFEDHWMTVGIVVSIGGALTVSIILALIFNIVTTRGAAGV